MASDAIHFLTIPPSREVAEQGLPPELRDWFATHAGPPTLAQRYAWPVIFNRQHLLLSAPTGSGKTLAAFLPILSQLAAQTGPLRGSARQSLQCLYIAPLKALCRDVRGNLRHAWRSMQRAGSLSDARVRIGLRTGDTSQRVRRQQLSDPPAILLTTPESLAQMLAHPVSQNILCTLRWVIVDEIHALVGNKRGADLAISLERLPADVQRIGLSATCTPLATVAHYLVGERTCAVAQVADRTAKQLVIEPLFENLDDSPSWLAAVLERLDGELADGGTTLIFTNTRNLAERLTWALKRRYPERQDAIGVHHSAISAARRRMVERRLKHGRLWVVVSSTSLELGIDIGSVERVVFVHPPGGVARLLQRVGRSGHRPDEPRRGLLLTASPGELLECAVTASSGRDGQIEAARMVDAPLDVLCQQLIGMAMTGVWSAAAAFALVHRAAPYRDLTWTEFEDCLDYLSGRRRDGTVWLPARLRWIGDSFTIADERTARLLRRNLGSILTEDACAVRLRVPTETDEAATQALGEVDLAYAERLQPGDRFVLDGRCLEVKKRGSEALLVDEVFGRPLVPRWLGNGLPMPVELARRIFLFRVQAAEELRDGDGALLAWLRDDFHLGERAGAAMLRYFQQQETVSEIPPLDALLIECVSMQSCVEYFVHTPLPRSANEALVRVLLSRWQAARKINANALAANLGFYLIVHAGEPVPPNAWRAGLHADRFADDLRASLADSDLLRLHFANVAQTGLMVMRNPAGRKRKVGGKDWAERRLFDRIRECAGDFVLLRQAEREVIGTACDLAAAQAFVGLLLSMPIRVRALAAPSPLGESLLRVGFQTTALTAEPVERARQ
jgi:ATP-dependent Lhr-like helicase